MKKQAILWFRCSRALWLKDGDQNTNFFRKKASNRRKRNFIWRLKDKDGVWKEEEEDVGRVLREYFIDLFSTEGLVAHTRSLSLSSLGCLMSWTRPSQLYTMPRRSNGHWSRCTQQRPLGPTVCLFYFFSTSGIPLSPFCLLFLVCWMIMWTLSLWIILILCSYRRSKSLFPEQFSTDHFVQKDSPLCWRKQKQASASRDENNEACPSKFSPFFFANDNILFFRATNQEVERLRNSLKFMRGSRDRG